MNKVPCLSLVILMSFISLTHAAEPPISEEELSVIRELHLGQNNKASTKAIPSPKTHDKKIYKSKINVYKVDSSDAQRAEMLTNKATKQQITAINERYKYNTSIYDILPSKIKDIELVQRINPNLKPLRLYKHASSKQMADLYFSSNQLQSGLFSSFVVRKISLEQGNIGPNKTLYDAFLNELTYNFALTPVLSVNNALEAEEKYLYINLRLNMSDRIKFWKYINIARKGEEGVTLPKDLTVADVLTAIRN